MAKSLFAQLVERTITEIYKNDLVGLKKLGNYCFSGRSELTKLEIPDSVTSIEEYAMAGCTNLTEISIPKNVSSIGNRAISYNNGAMNIANAYFYQPSGMEVTLPTAGSSTGMFYVKTARAMNVYTDNETIKNYAWSSDNITATLYHLDGTKW